MAQHGVFFSSSVSGKTAPSWLTKVMVWTLPIMFSVSSLMLAFGSYSWVSSSVETIGTVISVEQVFLDLEAETVLEGYYIPKFSYATPDGETVEALLSVAGEIFNYDIGSKHQILYDPAVSGNVRLPGFTYNYGMALAAGALAIVSTIVALLMWVWIKSIGRRRDQRGGT